MEHGNRAREWSTHVDAPLNFLVIVTDQQRADFRRQQGFALDTMPFLDQLTATGVQFDAAYTPMPICSPARNSMLTGRFPSAHGLIANWPPFPAHFARDLPQLMRDEGYECALFGKNHTYLTPDAFDHWRQYDHTSGPPRPGHEELDAAFDAWLENLGHWAAQEPTPFPPECQYPLRITSDFVQWLGARDESRPFFTLLSFPEPHTPVQAPEPYFSLFPPQSLPPPAAGPEVLPGKGFPWVAQYQAIKHYHPELDAAWPRYRATYCGMLRLLDDQLRRIVGALQARDLLQKTVVLFVADHGEFCGDYGLFRKGLGLPQCSIRVPMLWFGGPLPARGAAHPAHVSLVDILPTLCEAAGAEIPPGVQGRSLWPLLLGEPWPEAEFASIYVEMGIGGLVYGPDDALAPGAPEETWFLHGVPRTNFDGTRSATAGTRRALIRGEWKLIVDLEYPPELYHLPSDPFELTNLAARPEEAARLAALQADLLYWIMRTADNVQVRRYTPRRGPHNWQRGLHAVGPEKGTQAAQAANATRP